MKKIILLIYTLSMIFLTSNVLGQDDMFVDLVFTYLGLTSNSDIVEINSDIYLTLQIRNNGNQDAYSDSILGEGFIKCSFSDGNPWASPPIEGFYLPAGGNHVVEALNLGNKATSLIGKKEITCTINPLGGFIQEGGSDIYLDNNSKKFSFEIVKRAGGRFDTTMSKSVESIQSNLDARELRSGAEGIQDFIFGKVTNILIPIVIIIGLLTVILGFYTLMFKDSEIEAQKGVNYILWGVIGIIIIMSAKYISTILFEDIMQSGNAQVLSGIDVATKIYDQIIFPFFKIGIYLVMGVLFIILLTRVFQFITNPDDTIQQKAKTIIIWNTVSIIIIIGAKSIVEAIYGKRSQIENLNSQNLGDIGTGILASKNIPIIFNAINRILGISSFIILVIIIVQTMQLLSNPDDPEQIKKITKSILYIFIGLLIIGAGYLLVNFFIIN